MRSSLADGSLTIAYALSTRTLLGGVKYETITSKVSQARGTVAVVGAAPSMRTLTAKPAYPSAVTIGDFSARFGSNEDSIEIFPVGPQTLFQYMRPLPSGLVTTYGKESDSRTPPMK